MTQPILWAEQTWEQIADSRARDVEMVIFPIGSTEQHGPHLPLDVDTFSAEAVAHAVSARTQVPVLPTLPFGCALGHTRHWPGTLSLSPQTLTNIVREILSDVINYGFTRVLVLSGHVTNAAPLRCALEELRRDFPALQIAQKHVCEASERVRKIYESDADDWHANMAETALMQHLAPHLVREDRIFDDEDRTPELCFSYTVPQTSQAGQTGKPSEATPQIGAELFAMLIEDWTLWVQKALVETAPLRADLSTTSSTRKDVAPSLQPPICGPPR